MPIGTFIMATGILLRVVYWWNPHSLGLYVGQAVMIVVSVGDFA